MPGDYPLIGQPTIDHSNHITPSDSIYGATPRKGQNPTEVLWDLQTSTAQAMHLDHSLRLSVKLLQIEHLPAVITATYRTINDFAYF
jgi:hypothetical protein